VKNLRLIWRTPRQFCNSLAREKITTNPRERPKNLRKSPRTWRNQELDLRNQVGRANLRAEVEEDSAVADHLVGEVGEDHHATTKRWRTFQLTSNVFTAVAVITS